LIQILNNIIRQINNNFHLVLLDIVVVAIVPFIALFVRLDGAINNQYVSVLSDYIIYSIILSIMVFYIYGLYKRLWKYATVQDLFAIIGAVSVSNIMLTFCGIFFNIDLPRSIYIISWMFEVGLICFSRLIIRITSFMTNIEKKYDNKILIVGAGDAGAMVAREIKQRNGGQKIVGFIDDDTHKIGSKILGNTILASTNEIEKVVKEYGVDEIIIAIPSASGDVIRNISLICRDSGCKVKILPALYDLIEGKTKIKQLRNIEIEDLLRREPVKMNIEEISGYLSSKVVLVTGAGGSIGSELCRQIAKVNPEKIILLGRGENSIYEIHQELIEKYPNHSFIPVIADIKDNDRIKGVFDKYKPHVVFHAAAHKHVPLMEAQPQEAIKNNVFGTKNLVEAANDYSVETFIMISTDKAVNPTSIMGASKKVAEILVQNMNSNSNTKYAVVRFGNVLGSRGSVIPLFKKQIANGGPITITHPDMNRYFMTIPEASQLVLQAGALTNGGEIFVLDMGEPVKIIDMAKDLIELHGLIPDRDIKITFTGLRPGEKLYEELFTSEEGLKSTKHKKIYTSTFLFSENNEKLRVIDKLIDLKSRSEIIKCIKYLIPNYIEK